MDPEIMDAALKVLGPGLRRNCQWMTFLGAIFLGVPLQLQWALPQSLPPIDHPGANLDLLFSLLFLGEILCFAAAWAIPFAWQRLTRAQRRRSGSLDAATLSRDLGRAWFLRYFLFQGVCTLGALGIFAGYQDGLLTESVRLWLLGPLPLVALLWMLVHWPDEGRFRKTFQRS